MRITSLPLVPLHSLSCCAPRRPHVPPPASARHSLLASMWPRWHRYGQLECEGVRLMCSSACGSVVLLSFFISPRCVMSKTVPSVVSAVFLRWLFSTCCWSCRLPPPATCQSELRITHRVGAVAAVNRATSWLPGCDAARVCVCGGGGGSADLFQLVSLHVVSQDGAWHVTPLSGENLKKKKKKKTKSSCTSISVTFNLAWNKRNRTWELIFDGAKWRHNELYLRRSNLQSTVWQVLVELWIFRTSDGGSLLWLSSAACADTSKSKGGMILVLSTHQKS